VGVVRLSSEARKVLCALARDSFLKSHRSIDGEKVFRLHPLEGEPVAVQRATVDALLRDGLVTSNQKFPAATYMLTEKGRDLAAALTD
jgi:hypothetical protein